MSERFQVVIVGGGPVGVGLAVDLGLRGISCAVVERRVELQNIPKGQSLAPRTLEHFYFWGIVDELRSERIMPKGYPNTGVTAYGNLLSDYWYLPRQREQVREYFYQAPERLPQYLTEKVLRERMAQLPSVTNLFGWKAETISQDDAGVRVPITDGAGQHAILEGEFLVGCDGSHSLVRSQTGIERSGVDYDQKMLLAVIRSRELHEATKRFPDRATFHIMRPGLNGYWQFFGRVDVGETFFFHAPVPADTKTDEFDFLAFVQDAAGFEFAADLEYIGLWDLRVTVADTYQVGRALIAGDAAHSHPPYGGYGLNSGLEDAKNLGWKLAATLQGWGGDALLPSYSEERRPIFKETGEDFISKGIRDDAAWLERYNPDRDRAEFEEAWAARIARPSAVMSYEPNYEGSPVVDGPPGGKSSAHGTHSFTARTGHHLAPQLLSSGRNVFEELGAGFTLLAFGVGDDESAAFEQAAKSAKVPLGMVRDSFSGGREAYERKLILVRPDQYIAWCGDQLPADIHALLERVTGR
ncbi:MAG: FAD-dependent monooxygenase [Candidatus Lustribacter sp.]|jgi:2-polyprenyl-6-methoxyphenol hydroxylase-like FAD-dependent oxidoreductase